MNVMSAKKALIIVDMQNDFCPGGSFPVPDGNNVVRPLNEMLAKAKEEKWIIVASRDWHPESTLNLKDWKPHCIRNSEGAKFYPGLNIDDSVTVVSKGEIDLSDKHYSAFNGENINLEKYLNKNGVDEVYIGGLAMDYCVKNTALDAVKLGFRTIVLTDACRGIFKRTSKEDVEKDLLSQGVILLTIEKLVN